MAEMTTKIFGGLPVQLCSLHEQVDDPTNPESYDKGQVIDDPSLKLVCSTVRSGGKQRDEDVQPDRLDQIQLVDVERGADEPAPHHHSHKSSEEDIDDNKEKVAGNVASPSSVIAHDEPLSSSGRECPCFIKTLLDARMACKQDEVSRHYFASAKITP